MAVDENGLALAAEAEEDIADLTAADGVYAVGRLVEEDQVRVVDHRLRQADPLGHAFGIRADLAIGGVAHVDDVQQLGGALPARGAIHLRQRAEEFDDLPPGEITGEAVVLGEVTHAAQRRLVTDGLPEHRAGGAGGADDGHDDLDQGALAGAVGTEQSEDLTAADLHGDALEGVDAPLIALGDVAGRGGRHG